jgi:uncharacterized protein
MEIHPPRRLHIMTYSLYTATVPMFTRMLTNLSGVLTKADAFATERKIDPNVLVFARLAPDMNPLTFQVQSATDHSKFATSRISGRTSPAWADDETSFGELQARIGKALDYLKTFEPKDIDGQEDRPVTIKVRGQEVTMPSHQYFLERAQPNFFFHVTTAYAILRHNGVRLQKGDFLG